MSPSCIFNFHDADIILRSSSPNGEPCGCLDFHVHRCIMSAASPFFEAMLSLPQPHAEDIGQLPVIPFPESAAVLETLLRYVYPISDPIIESLDEIVRALEAARKYDLTAATDSLRRRLIAAGFLTTSPLRVYAIASRYELDEEAKIASIATLSAGLDKHPIHDGDLEAMSGYAYRQLLLLHEQRGRAAVALLKLPEEITCMACNGRCGSLDEPPRWWVEYKGRAEKELRARPTSAVVCSLGFLQQAAREAGCERCAGSMLASFWFFEELRRTIDALPV